MAPSIALAVTPTQERKSFPGKNLKSLMVAHLSGKVIITGSESDDVSIDIAKYQFSSECALTTKAEKSQLAIEVTSKKPLSIISDDCHVDLEISLPKKTALYLTSDTGRLRTERMEGSISFKLGSGEFSGTGASSHFVGKSGSGKIEIANASSGGNISSGSGSYAITFSRCPEKGELNLKSGSGDGTLLFPKACAARIQFTSGSGKLSDDGKPGSEGSFHVKARSGSGNLRVRRY